MSIKTDIIELVRRLTSPKATAGDALAAVEFWERLSPLQRDGLMVDGGDYVRIFGSAISAYKQSLAGPPKPLVWGDLQFSAGDGTTLCICCGQIIGEPPTTS